MPSTVISLRGDIRLDGGTVSSGTHEELLQNNEKYGRFIKLREEAASWKMQSV